MFHVERTLPVNPPETGAAPKLGRDHVWRGLVMKAESPVDFVPAITACDVIERTKDSLVRDIELRGEHVRERVTFEPERRVIFERLRGAVMGTIVNEIIQDDSGALTLRFTFDLEAGGLAPGSAEEREFAERMSAGYLEAVTTTLANMRRLVNEGVLG